MNRSLHRVLYVMSACMLAISTSWAAADVTGKTFFRPRSISEDSGLEMAMSNYRLYHSKHNDMEYEKPTDRSCAHMHGTYFYQESTNEEDLARYFMLGNKTELRVAGSAAADLTATNTRDIHAHWLDLVTAGDTFQGTFKIRPRRDVMGTVIKRHYDMSRLIKGLWVEAVLPVVSVEHNLNLTETNTFVAADFIVDTNLNPTTIIGALNNSDWLYGKWSSVKRRWAGVDDMQAKLGWNFIRGEKFHLGAYWDNLIPLGTRPSGEYVFEPTVGGVHYGTGLGLNLDWKWFGSERHNLSFQADWKYRYLFSDEERRTLDLTNGSFTRYLQFQKKNTGATTGIAGTIYGVNVLTRDLQVTPRGRMDMFTALHWKISSFHFEGGYNYWWKDRERVKLVKAFDDNIGVSASTQFVDVTAVSANNAVITDGFGVTPANGGFDANFQALTAANLDLSSATHDKASTHKFFGGLGVDYKFGKAPATLAAGGSYEVSGRNTSLENWAIWGKMTLNF